MWVLGKRTPAAAAWMSLVVLAGKSEVLLAQGPARDMMEHRWEHLWTVGGREQDTTLVYPSRLATDGRLVYVLDAGVPGITALDLPSGTIIWRFSRPGRGPGEILAPMSMALWPGGGIVVADNATRRFTVLDREGRVKREIVPRLPLLAEDVCVLADSSLLLVGPTPNGMLTRMGISGRVLAYPSTPDPALSLPGLRFRGGILAAAGNRCFLAMQFDSRFYTLGVGGVEMKGRTVERYTLGDTAKRAPGRHPQLGETQAAIAASADGQTLDVVFDGLTDVSGRTIDRYDAGSGRYRGSVLAPKPPVNRVVWMARVGEVFLFIHGIDGFAAVSAFRLHLQQSENRGQGRSKK